MLEITFFQSPLYEQRQEDCRARVTGFVQASLRQFRVDWPANTTVNAHTAPAEDQDKYVFRIDLVSTSPIPEIVLDNLLGRLREWSFHDLGLTRGLLVVNMCVDGGSPCRKEYNLSLMAYGTK